MINIVFLDSYSIAETSLEKIAVLGHLQTYLHTTAEQVVERSIDAQVVITNKVKLMPAQLDALPALRLICVAATGTNNVDVRYAQSRGIEVKNVPAYSTQSVAEATFAFALALLRHVPFYNDFVHSSTYATGDRCFNLDRQITEICHKKWGIIALGNIGRRVAAIADAFGAQVSYYSTSGQNKVAPYPCVSLEQLLGQSDIISIHAPLNEQTKGLIGARQISLLKPTAILINVGRGGIVDEAALADALIGNKIGGAALDVFDNEPIEIDSPLLKVGDSDHLILAPHCGWSSAEAREVLIATIASNISDSSLL